MPKCYECEECGTILNCDSKDTNCPNCGAPIKTESAENKEKELVHGALSQ